jgi:hypothetical protein
MQPGRHFPLLEPSIREQILFPGLAFFLSPFFFLLEQQPFVGVTRASASAIEETTA